MRTLRILLVHLLSRAVTFWGRGGTKSVLAENLRFQHQMLVIRRSRSRAAHLPPADRLLLGLLSGFLQPRRLRRASVILQPATLRRFHRGLGKLKCRYLCSLNPKRKPGPKGPAPELMQAICELKRHNPRFGCPRIAQPVARTFGVQMNKDVVRRVLARHYRPRREEQGPSWLTFLGHCKDSLWSLDLFRTESMLLKSHWVLVVLDQFSRRIIGFGVQAVAVDGTTLYHMFNPAISGQCQPVRLSSDHDPLFQFERWQANLRILGIQTVQTVPLVPWAHPFVERLIGTLRREYLDQLLFWNAADLERKLERFSIYFNSSRVHQGLDGDAPDEKAGGLAPPVANPAHYHWQSHCHGLFRPPVAA